MTCIIGVVRRNKHVLLGAALKSTAACLTMLAACRHGEEKGVTPRDGVEVLAAEIASCLAL